MIVRKLMFFLIIIAISSFAKEKIVFATGENVKTKLKKGEYYNDLKYFKEQMTNFFGETLLDVNQDGFYLEMGKWRVSQTEIFGDGSYSAYIPVKSKKMKMIYIPQYQCEDGPSMGKCRECLENAIWKNKRNIYDRCYEIKQISDSVAILIKKFFDENRLSLRKSTLGIFYSKRGEQCHDDFYILSQEKSERKIIRMVPPGCIDNEMKKNKIIDEYIYLYEQFYSIFHSNFEECRWENLADKKQLDKCLSY